VEYLFNKTFDNFFHFTLDSILPLVDKLEDFNPNDKIDLPKSNIFPSDLVDIILQDRGIAISYTAPIPGYGYLFGASQDKIKDLCKKLLTFLPTTFSDKPSIFMSFRLHNRRWLPIDNIQNLINKLCNDYYIFLSLNPKWEIQTNNHPGKVDLPIIENAELIYDLSYLEQLQYAKNCDYAIYMNGAGMTFPQIADLPSIFLTPCEISEANVLEICAPNGNSINQNIKVLSDKLKFEPSGTLRHNWYSDVTKVTVDQVYENFINLVKKG
jgi:hypothetical protein